MVSASDVEARLRTELAPTELRVEDIEGCGISFAVHVVSPAFEGKRLLDRHKMINAAVGPLMADIHALTIRKSKTPAEEVKLQQQQQQQQAGA